MKFLGMNIVPMLNPLKFSITTPLNFQKYAERINACSGILKFGVNPDQKGIGSQASIFLPCSPLSCVSVAQNLWRSGYVSAIAKYSRTFPTHRWVFLTLTVKNPPVTELRDTLKHMNDSWQRLIQTKRFKSGVAGFCEQPEVTRGE